MVCPTSLRLGSFSSVMAHPPLEVEYLRRLGMWNQCVRCQVQMMILYIHSHLVIKKPTIKLLYTLITQKKIYPEQTQSIYTPKANH